jgi:hypothetical protein
MTGMLPRRAAAARLAGCHSPGALPLALAAALVGPLSLAPLRALNM